jgi:dihydroflavonol-4-reductase
MSETVLVLGASGFLGSHVCKKLVQQGRQVRILVRDSSDTRSTDHLQLERCVGDVLNRQSIDEAMRGCCAVYYCVVDTRAWLRDPTPLYEVNVGGLVNAMDAALANGIGKFIFTSTFGTIGINPSGISTELDIFNWHDQAPHYILCRVEAEEKFMQYCHDKQLPGVAMCVANTYGADDLAPTPHGQLVRDTAAGNMPIYWDGGGPSVGIEDAAEALILAETKGRIGTRYIVSESYISFETLFTAAADYGGVKPPRIKIPIPLLYLIAFIVGTIFNLLGKDGKLSVDSIKCSRMLPNVDSSRAQAELGWKPRPILDVVPEAIDSYRDHSRE